MIVKQRILAELAADSTLDHLALLLPDLVNGALAANDRVKYWLSLLQTARGHADRADSGLDSPIPDLKPERLAAGIDDSSFDTLVSKSRRGDDSLYHIPGLERLQSLIWAAVDEMIEPFHAVSGPKKALKSFSARREALATGTWTDDKASGGDIAAIMSANKKAGDSLHLLVMDLHRALNRLQADIAQETLDGAATYNLEPSDRTLVCAFMRGLHSTEALKFGHCGLATTATRSGGRLMVQNDIGTTDSHVLVITVEGLAATVTYTDIRIKRLRFFQRLLKPFAVQWQDTTARAAKDFEGGAFTVVIGVFSAHDEAELAHYLERLGSRLVFLIDWNKARKCLGRIVGERGALALLRWAANHDVGHRGFLVLGGERLIFDAIDYAARDRPHYGEPLHVILGMDPAIAYLRTVLATTADGLKAGRGERLIRDEVKAELLKYFRTAHQGLLAAMMVHAELVFDLATSVRDAVSQATQPEAGELLNRSALRASRLESKADAVVVEARSMLRRSTGTEAFRALLGEADDAADSLEEAAFFLTLLPEKSRTSALLEPVQHMADLLLAGTQAFVSCLSSAMHVDRAGAREDLKDFLEAVDKVVAIEHETDTAVRLVSAAIVREAADFREMYLFSEIARVLEEATDSLSRAALMLSEYLLNEVMSP